MKFILTLTTLTFTQFASAQISQNCQAAAREAVVRLRQVNYKYGGFLFIPEMQAGPLQANVTLVRQFPVPNSNPNVPRVAAEFQAVATDGRYKETARVFVESGVNGDSCIVTSISKLNN